MEERTQDRLITGKEASQALELLEQSVRTLRDIGALTTYTVSGRRALFYRLSEVESVKVKLAEGRKRAEALKDE